MKKAFLLGSYCLLLSSLYAQPDWLDMSFGQGGLVRTDRNESNDFAQDLLLLPDGKLLVGGYTSDGIRDYFCLWRYLNNGSLDVDFGTDGYVLTTFPSTAVGASLARLPDGKILLAGHSWNGNVNAFALVRYLPDGALDASFGDGGKVLTSFPDYNAIARAMVVQADGKIILAGHAYRLDSDADDFALARYLPDGRLDASFGVDGRIRTSFTPVSREGVYDLHLQADGKIVAAGFTQGGFALARYTVAGLLDASFGEGTGRVELALPGAAPAIAQRVLPATNGKLLAVGFAVDTFSNFALAQFNADGSPDMDFADNGIRISRLSAAQDGALAATRQSDGKILAAGAIRQTDDLHMALARYLPTGELDPSFGENGWLSTAVGEDYNEARAVAVQADGKIVIAGITGSYPYDVALVRYLPGTISETDDPESGWKARLFPNPAISQVNFSLTTELPAYCQLTIYDACGRQLQRLYEGELPSGTSEWTFSLNGYPTGVYFFKLQHNHAVKNWRLLLP